MRSHGLRQLVTTSCQQTCCKLIISTGLLQVVSTSWNKSANDKLQQLSLILIGLLQLGEIDKLVDKLQQAGKIDNLQHVRGVFG